MTTNETGRRLLQQGATLLLVGLATGAAVPLFANPRMGLSAHLAGSLNGMILMILGLAWSHVHLSEGAARLAPPLTIASLYGIFVANVLGAALGTGWATPFASGTRVGALWAEILVTGVLTTSAVGSLIAMAIVVAGLRGRSAA